MKTLYYTLALSFLACSIILNICQYRQNKIYINKDFDSPVFVWNDDLESIYNFQDFLFQLDFERTMEDADASPNFHTRLLSELLTQIDDESKSSLLGTI